MTIGFRLGVFVQVLAGLVMTAVLLAAIELGAGFLVSSSSPQAPAPEVPGDTVSQTLTWIEVNPAPLIRDVDLLWRNEPGARKTQPVNPQAFGREEYWTIENNAEGLRGPDRPVIADGEDDVYRILCVGDSITFGFNVDQPGTYPRQLQELLETRHPMRHFEVVNGGVPGWSWLQGLRFVETRGLAIHPDLVIMGHGTNDRLLPARVTDEERFHRLAGPIAKAVQSAGLLLARTNTYRAIERIFPPPPFTPDRDSPGCKAQIRQSGACHRVSLDEIAAAVHEVNRVVTRAGIELLLVNLDFAETTAVAGVRRTADLEKLPFIDAVDALRGMRRGDEDARAKRLGLAPATRPGAVAAPADPPRSKRVVLRVLASDRAGPYRVQGSGYFQPAFTFSEPIYDDGTHGDEKSGDGVYSTTIEVPAGILKIVYVFYRDADAEFTTLPPLSSSMGDRLLAIPGDSIGPVHVFGDSPFMAERAHPNRDGQRIVATLIADRIEALPSFRRFVGVAAGSE